MGSAERRKAEKEAIKEKIYNATVEIIEKEGYEKLSIRKIANKIEYSPTHIYNYYKDKAAIIENIMVDTYDNVVFEVTNALAQVKHEAYEQQLRVFINTFIITMLREPRKAWTVFQSGINIFGDFGADKKESNNDLMELLKNGEKAGKFIHITNNTQELLIVSIFGFITFIIKNEITDKEKIDELMNEYSETLLHGFLKNSMGRNYNGKGNQK